LGSARRTPVRAMAQVAHTTQAAIDQSQRRSQQLMQMANGGAKLNSAPVSQQHSPLRDSSRLSRSANASPSRASITGGHRSVLSSGTGQCISGARFSPAQVAGRRSSYGGGNGETKVASGQNSPSGLRGSSMDGVGSSSSEKWAYEKTLADVYTSNTAHGTQLQQQLKLLHQHHHHPQKSYHHGLYDHVAGSGYGQGVTGPSRL